MSENMSGVDRNLFVIGCCQELQCFINVKKLPVELVANNKTWMISKIFKQYMRKWKNNLENKN
jgi:hypothetical protein